MNDSAPRWPGVDGRPGLDFSSSRSSDAPVSLYRDGSTLSEGVQAGGVDTKPSSPATPNRPEGAPSASQTQVKPALAPIGSDLERSQQSAAEWAAKPMVAGDAVTVDPAPKPARAAEPDVAPGLAEAAVAGGAAGGLAASTKPKLPKVNIAAPSRRTGARRTRKARLRLSRIDPWSVMKTTFLFSIAFGIMAMVITWVLWTVLSGTGAIDSVQKALESFMGEGQALPFKITDILNAPRVLGFAAVIAAIDVVIITAVSTLFAFLYNLAATVIGGLEVTLAED